MRRSQTLVSQAADRGTKLLADRIEHYVNVARDVSDILRERGEPQTADFVQLMADRARSASQYLRNNDAPRIWNDAQMVARDKTWLLAGVGLVSGLAVARALRTAADSDWDSSSPYVDSYARPTQESGASYERT